VEVQEASDYASEDTEEAEDASENAEASEASEDTEDTEATEEAEDADAFPSQLKTLSPIKLYYVPTSCIFLQSMI